MVNIFLSCSSKDQRSIEYIIEDLKTLPTSYNLIYFLHPYKKNIPMKTIIERLSEADLFIIFITDNSLDSEYVSCELKESIKLAIQGRIRGICPILLDKNINVELDKRIPGFIRNCGVYYSESLADAAVTAKKFILRF